MTKKTLTLAALALLSSLASPARADDHGLALGVRTSFAVPLGDAGDGARLRDLTSGAVPVQVELGYRLTRQVLAGAYFAWGYAMIADPARQDLRATGATNVGGHAVQRVGVQGIYTFLPNARFAPWAGVGVGYEWARYASADLHSTTGDAETEVGLRGFEVLVQAGGEYALSPRFTVGPFVTLNVGRFDAHVRSVSPIGGTFRDETSGSTDVADKGFHEWIQLGLKGSFSL